MIWIAFFPPCLQQALIDTRAKITINTIFIFHSYVLFYLLANSKTSEGRGVKITISKKCRRYSFSKELSSGPIEMQTNHLERNGDGLWGYWKQLPLLGCLTFGCICAHAHTNLIFFVIRAYLSFPLCAIHQKHRFGIESEGLYCVVKSHFSLSKV